MSDGDPHQQGFNVNSLGILGVICSVIASTWIIASKVNTARTDIIAQTQKEDAALRTDFGAAKTNIEGRISALEARPYKETWTDGDMFRWATRLQRENQNLKVPEPPMKADSPNR